MHAQDILIKLLERDLIEPFEPENFYTDVITDKTKFFIKPMNELSVDKSSLEDRIKNAAQKIQTSPEVSLLIEEDLEELYLFLFIGFLFRNTKLHGGFDFTSLKKRKIEATVEDLVDFNTKRYANMFTWEVMERFYNLLSTNKVHYAAMFSLLSKYKLNSIQNIEQTLTHLYTSIAGIFTGTDPSSKQLSRLLDISKGHIITI